MLFRKLSAGVLFVRLGHGVRSRQVSQEIHGHRCLIKVSAAAGVSTPSATSCKPSASASPMMARTRVGIGPAHRILENPSPREQVLHENVHPHHDGDPARRAAASSAAVMVSH